LIAWPVAYLIMTQWLSNFAFHISLPLIAFLSAGALTFIIAFLTVGIQAVRAAEANPIKSLKYE